jgi:hypothetical protein
LEGSSSKDTCNIEKQEKRGKQTLGGRSEIGPEKLRYQKVPGLHAKPPGKKLPFPVVHLSAKPATGQEKPLVQRTSHRLFPGREWCTTSADAKDKRSKRV